MHDYSTNSPHGALYWALARVLNDPRRCAWTSPIASSEPRAQGNDAPNAQAIIPGGRCFEPNGDVWSDADLWPDACAPDDTRPVCCPWRLCDATSEMAPRPDLDGLLAVFWGEARGATALFLGYSRCREAKPGQTPLERVSQMARAGGRCRGDNGPQGENTAALCSAP